MSLVKSRYLVTSERAYRRADGTVVRLGYLTRRAQVFSVDIDTAELLRSGAIDAIPAAKRKELARLGALVDAHVDERAEVRAGFRAGSQSVRQRSFTIMPTAYCNMGCSYCGQEHYKSRHSAERAERLLARIEAAMDRKETALVNVTWFGGEPLMAYRLIGEMSERLVARAEATQTRYHAQMASNGSLLTEHKLRYLHDSCRLRRLDITLDGPQEIHDRRRVLKNGRGSFERCVGVLSNVARDDVAPGLSINLRVNVDQENEAHVTTLLHDLAAAGLAAQRFTVQFMPVHSWGNDISAVELEARSYARRETEWLRLAADLGFGWHALPTGTKTTACTATTRSSEIHDPEGRIYSCSEHPLVPGVRDTGVLARTEDLTGAELRPEGVFDDWYDQVENASQPCNGCPLLPVCGGSCPKLWREGHLPCPSLKFNLQERLDLVAVRRLGLRAAETGVHAGR